MKVKFHNEFQLMRYILRNERYRLVIFLSVILALYAALVIPIAQENYYEALHQIYSWNTVVLFLFALFFMNQWLVSSIIKNDFPFYIMRLKSKKEYIHLQARLVFLSYAFQFLLIFGLILIGLFIFQHRNFDIHPFYHFYGQYSVSNFIYCLFYLLRFFLFGGCLISITTFIYILWKDIVTVLWNILFLVCILFFAKATFQTSLILNPWMFFTSTVFESFFLEVFSSVVFLIIITIISFLLYKIAVHSKRVEIL